MAGLRKGLLISTLTALLFPIASITLLTGAAALASSNTTPAVSAPGSQPKPPPPLRAVTLSMLGRARAIAWISHGHLGR